MTDSILDVRNLLTRRELFKQSGFGFGLIALGSLLAKESSARASGAAQPHFPPRAKHVIYLHMVGAPSQLDLFDYKPLLARYDNRPCPQSFLEGRRFAFLRGHPSLSASRFRFHQYGRAGIEMSELWPHLGQMADELCLIRSMHTDEFNHGPAQIFLHTGFGQPGRPSFGSWLSYGLGSQNQDLPAYVVLLSGPAPGGGSNLWSSGFLPTVHQGIQFRSEREPVLFLNNPESTTHSDRRNVLDAVRSLNQLQLGRVGDPEIATRISQYEMAFRMQTSVPELMDVSREPRAILEQYGATPGQASFANNCLLARRLVERGVRCVQLFDADWDHHGNLAANLIRKCGVVDRPIAALIRDLKRRGLLDETLVIWGGEFGRTPMQQNEVGNGRVQIAPGRDHHKDAFTMWLAGAGVKRGYNHGATDEFGFHIVKDPVHVHDLNATVLHLLGLNHERLTFRYQGRDFRLTDVHGNVVREILS